MSGFARRRLLLILGGLLVLLVLAVLLVPLLVPVERAKQIVAERIRAATGAEVTLGEAKVAVLPRLRLEVADVRIVGTGADLARASGSPTPLASYGATARELEVDLAFWPLLKRRIEVGTVRLIEPDVEIVTVPPQPEAAPGAPPPGPPAPEATQWQFAIAGFEVREGSLRWQEQGTGRSVSVTGWRQDVDVEDAAELMRRLARFQAGTGGAPAGAAPEGDGSPARGVMELETEIGTVSWQGFGPRPGSIGDLELKGSLRVPEADVLAVNVERAAWRSLVLGADLRLTGSPAQGRLSGTWRLDRAQLPALVSDLLALAPPPEGPAGQWLAEDPVRAGEIQGEGTLDLPWPLPQGAPPAQLAAGVSGQGRLQGGQIALPGGAGLVEASAAVTAAGGRLEVSDLQVRQAEGAFGLQGAAQLPLPGAAGALTADLRAEGDLARLSALAAAFAQPEPGKAPPPRLAGRLQAQLQANVPQAPPLNDVPAWKQALLAGGLQGVRLEGSIQDFSVALEKPPEPFHCPRLTFGGGLGDLRFACEQLAHPAVSGAVSGRLEQFAPPSLVLEGTLERLDLDALAASARPPDAGAAGPQPWRLVPAAQAAPAQAPPAAERPVGEAIPPDLTLAFSATAREVILQKAAYTDARAQGRLAQRVLTIEPIEARRSTGTLRGRAQVDWAADPYGKVSFQMTAQEVPVSALLEPYVPAVAAFWSGTVSTEATGDLLMRDPQRILQTLSLVGDAISSDGAIDARDMLSGIQPYLGGRQDLLQIKFSRFAHNFRFEAGRYHIQDLAIEGPDTDWLGDGWVGVDGTLDMALRIQMPPGFRPELGDLSVLAEQLRGPDGRIQLALRLTGRLADPNVQLDLAAAKQNLQQGAEQEIRRGVERLLDKFKRK